MITMTPADVEEILLKYTAWLRDTGEIEDYLDLEVAAMVQEFVEESN